MLVANSAANISLPFSIFSLAKCFKDLNFPKSVINLNVKEDQHSSQTASIMCKYDDYIIDNNKSTVDQNILKILKLSIDEAYHVRTEEEAIKYIDRIYAFIETLAPTFINSPPNPYLMQASNLMARWGVLGESVEVVPTEEFIRSLETMTVTFQDGGGNVLAKQPGSYLGNNPFSDFIYFIYTSRRNNRHKFITA